MKSSSPKPSCTPKTNLQMQWFLVMVVQMANTSNLWLLLKCGLFLSLSILSINLEWKHFLSSSQSLKRIFESIVTSNLQPLQKKLLPRVNFSTKSTKSIHDMSSTKANSLICSSSLCTKSGLDALLCQGLYIEYSSFHCFESSFVIER